MTELHPTLIAPTRGPTTASGQLNTAIPRCPTCGAAAAGLPSCKRDGSLLGKGSFSLGHRYRVDEALGSGGTAFVFGARHEVLGKAVAVKVLRNTHVNPFE